MITNQKILMRLEFKKKYTNSHIIFIVIFPIAYMLVSFLNISIFLKCYLYCTIWYICLGIAHIVVSLFERKLVEKKIVPVNTSKIAGIAIICTGPICYIPILLHSETIDHSLIYGGLIDVGLILTIYFITYIIGFMKIVKILYAE